MGTAASFGAILFLSGDKREILPHSKIMIHDPLIAGSGLTGSATLLHTQIDSLMETREILANIIVKHTKKTIEEIYEKTATDTWFNATQAIEFGLADNIITNKKEEKENTNE